MSVVDPVDASYGVMCGPELAPECLTEDAPGIDAGRPCNVLARLTAYHDLGSRKVSATDAAWKAGSRMKWEMVSRVGPSFSQLDLRCVFQ